MKPHSAAMKVLLRRREAILQKLIRQMKSDKLDSSAVYKNLENELQSLKDEQSVQEKNQ
jgi:hypothetical protein